MTPVHIGPMTDQTSVQWLIAAGILLTSALVLANDAARLEIPPGDGEILSDDIYERAEGWRQPVIEDEWRTSKPEPSSRIRFGYDSTYEELRARDRAKYSNTRTEFLDRPPANQFQLRFK